MIRLDDLYLSHNGEFHLLQQLKMHKNRKKNQTNIVHSLVPGGEVLSMIDVRLANIHFKPSMESSG